MKLFSEFSRQIACEIGQTFVCFSRFVSIWPASEVVEGPFELCSALNKFWSRQKMQSHLDFGLNDRFLFFLTPEKTDCPLVRLGPKTQKQPHGYVHTTLTRHDEIFMFAIFASCLHLPSLHGSLLWQ